MNTITIPKNITKGTELVIIPRKEYERFLLIKKKEDNAVEEAIEEGLRDLKAGRVYGPFKSAKAMLRSLHHEARKLKNTS